MPLRIRPMRLEDIEEVMEIEPVAFGSHHWSHQSFVNELNNSIGNYFAAFDISTKQLCGYTGFWLIDDEAHITTLAVHPDFRRQHIGERLLVHDILEARRTGARWITLEVRVSNEGAQRLYYKYGFKNLGLRKNYYQDNDEDALVLWTENISSAEFMDLVKRRIEELAQYDSDAAQQEAQLSANNKTNGNGNSASPSSQADKPDPRSKEEGANSPR